MKTRAHKVRLQVTLTPDALAWLQQEAETRGFSLSAAIEQLVRDRMLETMKTHSHAKETAQ